MVIRWASCLLLFWLVAARIGESPSTWVWSFPIFCKQYNALADLCFTPSLQPVLKSICKYLHFVAQVWSYPIGLRFTENYCCSDVSWTVFLLATDIVCVRIWLWLEISLNWAVCFSFSMNAWGCILKVPFALSLSFQTALTRFNRRMSPCRPSNAQLNLIKLGRALRQAQIWFARRRKRISDLWFTLCGLIFHKWFS